MKNLKLKPILKVVAIIMILGMITVAATSCIRIVGIRGSGNVVSEDRDVSGFDRVSISSGMNLYIEQGDSESLRIEAEDNIISRIATDVRNGELEIKYKYPVMHMMNINTTVNIYLTVKDLKELDLSSGVTVESEEIKTDSLQIDISSGGLGKMVVDTDELVINLSSGSSLEISGRADEQDIDLGSGSEYDAKDLVSKFVSLDASSGSNATVNVSETLKVDISSGATVEYSGTPKVTSDVSSGAVLKSLSND